QSSTWSRRTRGTRSITRRIASSFSRASCASWASHSLGSNSGESLVQRLALARVHVLSLGSLRRLLSTSRRSRATVADWRRRDGLTRGSLMHLLQRRRRLARFSRVLLQQHVARERAAPEGHTHVVVAYARGRRSVAPHHQLRVLVDRVVE